MATIAVLGTLDTKGSEHQYVADFITELGHTPLLIDVGTGKPPKITPHITREQVANMAGINPALSFSSQDEAVTTMSSAASCVLKRLLEEEKIDGVISIGGEHGTAIATAAMRSLPIGMPKIMVSSLSLGCTSQYVGHRDIIMFPSVADVSGLNRLLRPILAQATGAICGITEFSASNDLGQKPIIVVSTSPHCVTGIERAISVIEKAGYEILRIAADGNGGHGLESIIDSNLAAGILDFSLREFGDDILDGLQSVGPKRLSSAARTGIPAVIVPGELDTFTVPESWTQDPNTPKRTVYREQNKPTLIRTNSDESARLGKALAEKLNQSIGPVSMILPLRGMSNLSTPGQPLHDPESDHAFFHAFRANANKRIHVREMKASINDTPFAEACARTLLGSIRDIARDHENLKKVEFFACEQEPFLREITRMLTTEVFIPGDFIIKQGDTGDCMYFLVQGTAEVIVNDLRVAKLGPGAPFGEMALVSGERRNASIRAAEYCEVHRLPKEDFNLLRTKHPAFDARVRAIVKQRIMSNLHT